MTSDAETMRAFSPLALRGSPAAPSAWMRAPVTPRALDASWTDVVSSKTAPRARAPYPVHDAFRALTWP